MLDALHAYLYYSSVFSDMKIKEPLSIDYAINGLCMMLTQLLSNLLNCSQYLIKKCWDFLQFGSFEDKKYGENNAAADLFDIFSTYIWIPILISLVVLAIYFFKSAKDGGEKARRFSLNLITLVVVMALLPTVFTHINVNVFHNYKDDMLSIDSETTSSKIFYKHTTDYLYIYKKYVKPMEKQAKKYSGDFKSFAINSEPTSTLLYILSDKDSQGNYKLLSSSVKVAAGDYKGKHYKNQLLSWSSDNVTRYTKFKSLNNFDINETIVSNGTLASDEDIDDNEILEQDSDTNVDTDPNAKDYEKIDKEEKAPEFLQNKLRDGAIKYIDNFVAKEIKNGTDEDHISDEIIKEVNNFGEQSDILVTKLNDFLDSGIITSLLSGILGREYFRYRVDFLCVWVEMLANIFLYFAASFALLKIAWELVVNRIFLGCLAAIDLTGGDKMKRALNGILGLYISIMFVGFSIVLYNNACDFARDTLNISGFAYVVVVFMLSSITLDTPNIIAKYFGIETGMRAGGSILKRAVGTALGATLMAARTASMHHRYNKMNSQRATAAANGYRNASPFQKMMHPLTYSKSKMYDKIDDKMQRISNANKREAILNKGDVLKSSEKSQYDRYSGKSNGKYTKPTGTRYDTQGGFSEEKKKVKKNNPSLDNDELDKITNNRQADKFSGTIQKQALLNQAQSIADGNLENNKNVLNSAINKINDANGDRLFSKNADTNANTAQYMNQDNKFNSYKETAFEDISSNARNKNSNPTMDDYMNSARAFAGKDADNKVVEVLANQTYAFDNADRINEAAKRYQSSQIDTEKLSLNEARAYIMSHNNDYFSTPINPEYADAIALEMEKRGYVNKETRNLGANNIGRKR